MPWSVAQTGSGMNGDSNVTEAERIWRSKSDDDVIDAAGELSTYTEEGQRVIRAELRRRGLEDPHDQARFTAAALGVAPAEPLEPAAPGPECLRCEVRLRFVGTKEIREGTARGAIGELGHLSEKRSSFDVYVCPRCGHVDFFVEPDGTAGDGG